MSRELVVGRRNSAVALREADKIFRKVDTAPGEYAKADKAFHDNRERLKAERLARESSREALDKAEMTAHRNDPIRRSAGTTSTK